VAIGIVVFVGVFLKWGGAWSWEDRCDSIVWHGKCCART